MVLRNTPARVEITATIRSSGRPISAVEILRNVAKKRADLNKTTIYRFLKALIDTGELVAISVPGKAARYELKDVAGHPHFVCQECSEVVCLTTEINLANLLPTGFQISTESVVLSGRCPRCSFR